MIARKDLKSIPAVGTEILEECGCVNKVLHVFGTAWGQALISQCAKHLEQDKVAAENTARQQLRIKLNTRLREIDLEVGPRPVREIFLSRGENGFNDKIQLLEAEAAELRAQLAELQ